MLQYQVNMLNAILITAMLGAVLAALLSKVFSLGPRSYGPLSRAFSPLPVVARDCRRANFKKQGMCNGG